MEIRVLRYFLETAREENMTRAAERLFVSQPTMSKQLKELEKELIAIKPKASVENRYVQTAIEYIEKHYAEPDFSIGKLADYMSVSEGHISRLFKAETEISINNYLTRYRIRKAMDYLKDVNVKVYEVAEKVGYQDIAYFSNTFKKLVGKTPSDYQTKGLG